MTISAKQLYWAAVLLVSFIGMRVLAAQFSYETPWSDKPVYSFVGMLIVAGVAYAVLVLDQLRSIHKSFWVLIGVGLLMRLLWLGSEPILEDDSYRYFWDGALVLAGLNPYTTAPIDALTGPLFIGETLDVRLEQIAANGAVERVAYPTVTTIYPPLAQLTFAVHGLLDSGSWNLDLWRFMLLGFDCVTLALLIKLLSILKKPTYLALVFWLNPLAIITTINAGHMDALLLPFLVGAGIALVRYRFQLAAVCLVTAVGIKIWPIMLAPLFAGYWYKQASFLWRQIIGFLMSVSMLSLIVLAPQLLSNLNSSAGLVAYSSDWHTNSMIFTWVLKCWQVFTDVESGTLARVTIISFMLLAILLASFNPKTDPTKNLLWITAALFFLSPTGYPWYFIWLLPWLALNPSPALLALTVTLPLYFLRFTPFFDQNPALYQWVIVPLQFLPPLLLLMQHKIVIKESPPVLRYA